MQEKHILVVQLHGCSESNPHQQVIGDSFAALCTVGINIQNFTYGFFLPLFIAQVYFVRHKTAGRVVYVFLSKINECNT